MIRLAGIVFLALCLGGAVATAAVAVWGGEEVGGNHDWRTIVVNYQGAPLTCLQFAPRNHDQRRGGISCDYVAYHGLGRRP